MQISENCTYAHTIYNKKLVNVKNLQKLWWISTEGVSFHSIFRSNLFDEWIIDSKEIYHFVIEKLFANFPLFANLNNYNNH